MCLDFARLAPYTIFTSSLHLFCRRSPEASLFGCRPPLQPIYTPSPRGSPRHEWWPKRKAEPRKVGSVALRWRATSVRGASFHGKHQPRRDARPNSPALEAGKSFEGQSYDGRSAGDRASRLLSVSCAEHLRVGTGACSYQGRITIQGWGTATMTNKANRTTSATKTSDCGSIDAGKVAYRRVAGFFTKRYTKRNRHTGTTIVPTVSATAIRCTSMRLVSPRQR
jgi:hypothetical protein